MTGAGGSRTAPTGGGSRAGLKPAPTGDVTDCFRGDAPTAVGVGVSGGLGGYYVDEAAGDVDQLSDGFALGVGLNSRAGQGHLSHFFF